MEKEIIRLVEEKLNCRASEASVIGKGASGSAYKVKLDSEPYNIAVKTSGYPQLLFDEYNRIDFISRLQIAEVIFCRRAWRQRISRNGID